MIKVYFESGSHAELVAVFETEELFSLCVETLEREAAKHRMTVTESIEEYDLNDCLVEQEKNEVLIVPDSSQEGSFEDIEDFNEALKTEDTYTPVFQFSTRPERDAFLLGYKSGIGYMGTGLYYIKN